LFRNVKFTSLFENEQETASGLALLVSVCERGMARFEVWCEAGRAVTTCRRRVTMSGGRSARHRAGQLRSTRPAVRGDRDSASFSALHTNHHGLRHHRHAPSDHGSVW
jgi:hypothetical protein